MSHSTSLKEVVGVEEPCPSENPVFGDSEILEFRGEGWWRRSQAGLDASFMATAMLLSHKLLCFEAINSLEEDLRCESQATFFFPILVSNLRHLLSTLGPSASEDTTSAHLNPIFT